jgi:ATP-binding cassette subfamily B protein AbcA/BmrA
MNTGEQQWGPFLRIYGRVKIPLFLYVLSCLFQLGATQIGLWLPLLIGDIMAGNIFDMTVIAKYAGFTLAASFLDVFYGLADAVASARLVRNARKYIWSKIIRFPMAYFGKEQPSSLVSRVTNDPGAISGPFTSANNVISNIYALVGALFIMYGMNQYLTFLLVPVVPWALVVSSITGGFNYKVGARLQLQNSKMTGFFAEALANIRLIKFSGAEETAIKTGESAIENQYKVALYKAKIDLFQTPVTGSIDAIIKIVVLVMGAGVVATGEMAGSDLIAFYLLSLHLMRPTIGLLGEYQALKNIQGTASKIGEICDGVCEPFEQGRSFGQGGEDIEFKQVYFGYGSKQILSDISFRIPKGKCTAIVGASGSGKTTLFNLIERFYQPTQGEILFGTAPLAEFDLQAWRKGFGYVSQSSPLLSGTIADNITYGVEREISEQDLIRAARLANAYEFIQKLPQGFQTEVGEVGGRLSGGERQRLAIARAIIKNPQYLLLDEATCSLDAHSETMVQKALENLMQGRTTIIIAHKMNTIIHADQIVVLEGGRISAIGTYEELYKGGSVFKKFVDLQSGSWCA